MAKRTLIILAVIAVIAISGYSWVKGRYNGMVVQDENVKTAWSQVENQYQRRSDLIPNLVNTVRGYASHERQTLEAVIEARARASQTVVDPTNLNEASIERFQAAQGQLSSALSRLMVVLERYPDLKANENFRELQAQLEGTENRIAVERMRFNEASQNYNTYVRTFPNSVLAGMFGFEQKAYFASQPGAELTPSVNFEPIAPAVVAPQPQPSIPGHSSTTPEQDAALRDADDAYDLSPTPGVQ